MNNQYLVDIFWTVGDFFIQNVRKVGHWKYFLRQNTFVHPFLSAKAKKEKNFVKARAQHLCLPYRCSVYSKLHNLTLFFINWYKNVHFCTTVIILSEIWVKRVCYCRRKCILYVYTNVRMYNHSRNICMFFQLILICRKAICKGWIIFNYLARKHTLAALKWVKNLLFWCYYHLLLKYGKKLVVNGTFSRLLILYPQVS